MVMIFHNEPVDSTFWSEFYTLTAEKMRSQSSTCQATPRLSNLKILEIECAPHCEMTKDRLHLGSIT